MLRVGIQMYFTILTVSGLKKLSLVTFSSGEEVIRSVSSFGGEEIKAWVKSGKNEVSQGNKRK